MGDTMGLRPRALGARGLSFLLGAYLAASCASPEPVAPIEDEAHDDPATAQVTAATIGSRFHEVDGFLVSPPLEGEDGATRVGFMFDFDGGTDATPPRLEARGIDGGAYTAMQITWREGGSAVAIVDLDRTYEAIEVRLPAGDAARLERLTYSAVIPAVKVADLDPASNAGVGSQRQALAQPFAAAGVVSREAWGARATECSTDDGPKWRAAIHHTAGVQSAGGDVAKAVRQIQAFHMDSRGWCDIGYHFLVSHDGKIWEGRPSHLRGAHAGPANPGNVGISLMGCYDDAPECPSATRIPSQAILEAAGKILGVSAQTWGFPINNGTVMGHRDWQPNHTACPGGHVWGRLGDIRNIGNGLGACTQGAIDAKYKELGGPGGVLGWCLTPETPTLDGVGRFNHFQFGSIFWHPDLGPSAVWGDIRVKWAALDWEVGFLGYPITDELPTRDGLGRFNHFQHGSIYWHPATGPHDIKGPIRDRWAETDWEMGPLGFPTSGEQSTPDGWRFNTFQHGTIRWQPTTGIVLVE